MASITIFFIKTYQFLLSPDQGILFPQRVRVCKFYPSCSAYAVKSLQIHGFFRGLFYAVRRVTRCHPWAEGGYDNPPPLAAECKISNF
ncbi:MAG: membrane protein insertion efficiency factor YidD [Patescibacteria group bacterium]